MVERKKPGLAKARKRVCIVIFWSGFCLLTRYATVRLGQALILFTQYLLYPARALMLRCVVLGICVATYPDIFSAGYYKLLPTAGRQGLRALYNA